MELIRALFAMLARICLSAIFLMSGISQILYWKEAEKKFMNVISDWQTFTIDSESFQVLFAAMAIWTPILLIVVTFLEILGALLLLFGIKEKLGAILLIIVLVFTTILVQHFWFSDPGQKELQLSLFLRDMAILGGLLIVALQGTKLQKGSGDFAKFD